MSDEIKLNLAIIQVQNILSLIRDNQYEQMMKQNLYRVHYELQRQLSLLTNSKHYHKIEE
jgi:hypothetical protein